MARPRQERKAVSYTHLSLPMNSMGLFGLHMITAGVLEGESHIRRENGSYKRLCTHCLLYTSWSQSNGRPAPGPWGAWRHKGCGR